MSTNAYNYKYTLATQNSPRRTVGKDRQRTSATARKKNKMELVQIQV